MSGKSWPTWLSLPVVFRFGPVANGPFSRFGSGIPTIWKSLIRFIVTLIVKFYSALILNAFYNACYNIKMHLTLMTFLKCSSKITSKKFNAHVEKVNATYIFKWEGSRFWQGRFRLNRNIRKHIISISYEILYFVRKCQSFLNCLKISDACPGTPAVHVVYVKPRRKELKRHFNSNGVF